MVDCIAHKYQITHKHLHKYKDCRNYAMPTITRKLILIGAELIKVKDKKTHEEKGMWKYTFMTPEMNAKGFPVVINGYDPEGKLTDKVIDTLKWDDNLAKEYKWELKDFQGEWREKLIVS